MPPPMSANGTRIAPVAPPPATRKANTPATAMAMPTSRLLSPPPAGLETGVGGQTVARGTTTQATR
jgi:hypothetical protein